MAKASGSIDLKAYNSASQEATNYISYDPQTGLTVGQEDLDSKVVISGDGVKLYDENGNVGTEIKSGEVIVGTDETNQITLNEDGIVLSSVEDIETFKAGVSETAVALEYVEQFYNSSGGSLTLSKAPDNGSEIRVQYKRLGNTYITRFTQGYAETQGDITYDGDLTFTFAPPQVLAVRYSVIYQTTAHPPYLTFGTRDTEADIGAYSATFGRDLIASKEQTVFGKSNVEDTNGDYSIIVGNGNRDNARSNALAMDWNGNVRLKGDVYVGCNADSTGGNKLVSASTSTGSGTKANMASSTNLSNLAELTLPEEGVYILVGLARFPSNSNGRRGLAWGTSATGYYDHSSVVVPPASGAVTRIQSVAIVTATSEDYKVYLNAYHTAGSGTQLNVDYYWRYIKLA